MNEKIIAKKQWYDSYMQNLYSYMQSIYIRELRSRALCIVFDAMFTRPRISWTMHVHTQQYRNVGAATELYKRVLSSGKVSPRLPSYSVTQSMPSSSFVSHKTHIFILQLHNVRNLIKCIGNKFLTFASNFTYNFFFTSNKSLDIRK